LPQAVSGALSKDILKGIGLTILIFSISIHIPIIGFFFCLLTPLPVLFYRVKLGRNNGAVIPAVAIFSMIVILGGISPDILLFAGLIILGFTLGGSFEMNLSVEKTILFSSAIVFFTGLAGWTFYSNSHGMGPVAMLSEHVTKSLDLTIELYKKMGVPEENLHMISNSLDEIKYYLVRIIPSITAALTLLTAWMTLLFARPIFKNMNLFLPDFGRLNLWKAPEYLMWGVIACGLTILLPDKTFKVIGFNGLIVLMTIYFFQGIAIVSFYFEKKGVPRILKIFIYSLIAIQQIILMAVIGLGFFDVWFDFRKLELKESE
jgi:uncharacterized protein YybS (DUF2232 family)